MNYGVIMAGGSGTRLWPLSRADRPKQLLPVIKGKSLIALSYERLRALLPPERIFVCTAAAHADAVLEALPELPRQNIMGEPMGRDTANAVGFSAAILHARDKDAVVAITTADHVIEPIDHFTRSMQAAFELVARDPKALVTFGIVPTHGHTGLGYVQRGKKLDLPGTFNVLAFKEKPAQATADAYVESGEFYWNSGMFVWRADTVLGELEKHLPNSAAGMREIAAAWGTAHQQKTLGEVYPRLPKISVDYAIMEPASQGRGNAHVAVVELDIQWLDVGSWPALAETLEVDDHNNAVDAKARAFIESDDNIVISTDAGHLVALINVNDMIVVHTPTATMVCPKSEAQRVKDMVAKVKDQFGETYL